MLSLAISDISLNLWCIAGAIIKQSLLFHHPASPPPSIAVIVFQREVWLRSGCFLVSINRFLTLYVTLQRLRSVCSVTHAKTVRDRSTGRHVRDTLLYGVLPGGAANAC